MDDFRDFIEQKRVRYEQALERHAIQGTRPKFKMRLRVRLASKLAAEDKRLKFSFLGRRVTLQSRNKDNALNSSEWVVFTASSFKSIESAAEFGLALQAGLAIVASMKGIAIDVGAESRATFATSNSVKEAVAKVGGFLLDDVHGVDVFADLPNSIIMFGEATITTSLTPATILEPLEKITSRIKKLDQRALEAAFLMNAAFIAQHPVAMLTLSIAAVEMLAAVEKWNESQKEWIKSLRQHLVHAENLSETEKGELRQAIDSLFNFGALAKSRRLLNSLELHHLRDRWEVLYKGRSNLFHGNTYLPSSEIQNLGGEARTVCKEIVDAYLGRYFL